MEIGVGNRSARLLRDGRPYVEGERTATERRLNAMARKKKNTVDASIRCPCCNEWLLMSSHSLRRMPDDYPVKLKQRIAELQFRNAQLQDRVAYLLTLMEAEERNNDGLES